MTTMPSRSRARVYSKGRCAPARRGRTVMAVFLATVRRPCHPRRLTVTEPEYAGDASNQRLNASCTSGALTRSRNEIDEPAMGRRYQSVVVLLRFWVIGFLGPRD